MSWLYVPGLVASNSDCELPSLKLASSVTWRGKPSLQASWSRRWKTARWLQRLSGLICFDSTLSLGVESWIASLQESRVSLTQSQGSAPATTTSAPCGPSSAESWKSVDPPWSGSKTSLLLFSTSNQSEIDYQHWATGLRLEYSARVKSARRIDANDSLLWPTATGQDSNGHAGHYPTTATHQEGLTLATAAQDWPTPNVPNGGRKLDPGYVESKGQTPTGKRQVGLENASDRWATPMAADDGHKVTPPSHQNSLIKQADARATPNARDGNDRSCERKTEYFALGRQVLKGTGAESRKSLNPRFVEWLMGWPLGWTAFERVEMASYLLKQRRLLSRWLEGYSNES